MHKREIDQLSQCEFFLDVTPLLDTNWTGISVVCANVARQLLRHRLSVKFCLHVEVLPTNAVMDALDRSTGLFLSRDLETGRLSTKPIHWTSNLVSVGVSTSVKRLRGFFDVEFSWIHDLSTILQPHYHTIENIHWHTESVLADLYSNDLTVCISKATYDDLVNYLGAKPKSLVIARNGAEWPWWFEVKAQDFGRRPPEPYLLILGTREPRKNIQIIFEMLLKYPQILKDYKIVFVGGQGWHANLTALPSELLWAIGASRIVFTGFISDFNKFLLLRNAEATIFPSVFEGFGLPVIESLSVGTPCVSSFSSSLPEVGGSLCSYFDPFSADDLFKALARTLSANLKSPAYLKASMEWTSTFTWAACIETVLSALTSVLVERGYQSIKS